MNANRNSPAYLYTGAVIIAAMTLGGGTGQGLWTDHVIEILMIPTLFIGIAGLADSRTDIASRVFVGLLIIVIAIQFIPVHRASPAPEYLPNVAGWALLSQAPQKAIEAAAFFLCALGFALFVTRLTDRDQIRAVRFFFAGFFVNLVAAIVQLSYGTRARLEAGVFPYDMKAGLFANENHLSSLCFMMIPLIAWYNLVCDRRPIRYLAISGAIVFFLFAVGSRAGMTMSFFMAILCIFWFWSDKVTGKARIAILAGVLALLLPAIWFFVINSALDEELRMIFYRTAWRAIEDHWLTGSGLGSFTLVYPSYETPDTIAHVVANHAHNDYLELILEMGMPGLALLIFFFLLLFANAFRNPLTEAAFLSVMALCIHSLADYPIRTFALATPFAFLVGLIFSARPHGLDLRESPGISGNQSSRQADFGALVR